MSLILGVHLAKKVFLISDTRATVKYVDGRKEIKDDLIKVFNIGKGVTALTAGDAKPAIYLLTKLKQLVQEDVALDEFKLVLKSNLKRLVSEYVNRMGEYGNVGLIIAGFNPGRNKKIESSVLGQVMSAELVAKGEGSGSVQTIDVDIQNSLAKAIMQAGVLEKGSMVKIENTIDSGMFGVHINIKDNLIKIIDVPCYQPIAFHPDQSFVKIDLSREFISQLEFGQRQSTNWEDMLYEDSEKLLSSINKQVQKYKFETVGGNFFVGLVTPNNYFMFPTGDIGTFKDGKIVMTGSIFVDKKNGLSYILRNGKVGKYRFVKDLHPKNLESMLL